MDGFVCLSRNLHVTDAGRKYWTSLPVLLSHLTLNYKTNYRFAHLGLFSSCYAEGHTRYSSVLVVLLSGKNQLTSMLVGSLTI
jgi:hypothetical protein